MVVLRKSEDPYDKLKKADPSKVKDNSYLLMYSPFPSLLLLRYILFCCILQPRDSSDVGKALRRNREHTFPIGGNRVRQPLAFQSVFCFLLAHGLVAITAR